MELGSVGDGSLCAIEIRKAEVLKAAILGGKEKWAWPIVLKNGLVAFLMDGLGPKAAQRRISGTYRLSNLEKVPRCAFVPNAGCLGGCLGRKAWGLDL